jgi:hypothetical protein
MLRLLLPEPAGAPGVETGFDENEYDAPETRPERLRA